MTDDVDLGAVYYVIREPKQDPARVVAGPIDDLEHAENRATFEPGRARVMLGVWLVYNVREQGYTVEWADAVDAPAALIEADGGRAASTTGAPTAPFDVEGLGTGSYRVLDTFDEVADEEVCADIREKTQEALRYFPELSGRTVTVGRLDPDENPKGRAQFWNLLTLYPTDSETSYVTVFHELAHLAIHVRRMRGEDVPITSEEFCGILGMSRMPVVYIDEGRVPYLGEPSAPRSEWPDICRRALAYREDHHAYIQQCREWLEVDDAE